MATAGANLAASWHGWSGCAPRARPRSRAHAKEEAELAGLVKIYKTMKPKPAAEIFNRLEMPILIGVVERMRAPKAADVLTRMDRPRPSR